MEELRNSTDQQQMSWIDLAPDYDIIGGVEEIVDKRGKSIFSIFYGGNSSDDDDDGTGCSNSSSSSCPSGRSTPDNQDYYENKEDNRQKQSLKNKDPSKKHDLSKEQDPSKKHDLSKELIDEEITESISEMNIDSIDIIDDAMAMLIGGAEESDFYEPQKSCGCKGGGAEDIEDFYGPFVN